MLDEDGFRAHAREMLAWILGLALAAPTYGLEAADGELEPPLRALVRSSIDSPAVYTEVQLELRASGEARDERDVRLFRARLRPGASVARVAVRSSDEWVDAPLIPRRPLDITVPGPGHAERPPSLLALNRAGDLEGLIDVPIGEPVVIMLGLIEPLSEGFVPPIGGLIEGRVEIFGAGRPTISLPLDGRPVPSVHLSDAGVGCRVDELALLRLDLPWGASEAPQSLAILIDASASVAETLNADLVALGELLSTLDDRTEISVFATNGEGPLFLGHAGEAARTKLTVRPEGRGSLTAALSKWEHELRTRTPERLLIVSDFSAPSDLIGSRSKSERRSGVPFSRVDALATGASTDLENAARWVASGSRAGRLIRSRAELSRAVSSGPAELESVWVVGARQTWPSKLELGSPALVSAALRDTRLDKLSVAIGARAFDVAVHPGGALCEALARRGLELRDPARLRILTPERAFSMPEGGTVMPARRLVIEAGSVVEREVIASARTSWTRTVRRLASSQEIGDHVDPYWPWLEPQRPGERLRGSVTITTSSEDDVPEHEAEGVSVTGSRSREQVMAVARKKLSGLERCLRARAATSTGSLTSEGRESSLAALQVSFVISPSGRTRAIDVRRDEALDPCGVAVVRSWRFLRGTGTTFVSFAVDRALGRLALRGRESAPSLLPELSAALAVQPPLAAVDKARAWVARAPGSRFAWFALGLASSRAGHADEARRAFDSMLDLATSELAEEERRFAMAAVLSSGGQLERAETAKGFVEPQTARLLAFDLARRGRHAEAFELLERALLSMVPIGRYPSMASTLKGDLALLARAWSSREPGFAADLDARLLKAGAPFSDVPARLALHFEGPGNVDLVVFDELSGRAARGESTLEGAAHLGDTQDFGPEVVDFVASPDTVRVGAILGGTRAVPGFVHLVEVTESGELRVSIWPFVLDRAGALIEVAKLRGAESDFDGEALPFPTESKAGE